MSVKEALNESSACTACTQVPLRLAMPWTLLLNCLIAQPRGSCCSSCAAACFFTATAGCSGTHLLKSNGCPQPGVPGCLLSGCSRPDKSVQSLHPAAVRPRCLQQQAAGGWQHPHPAPTVVAAFMPEDDTRQSSAPSSSRIFSSQARVVGLPYLRAAGSGGTLMAVGEAGGCSARRASASGRSSHHEAANTQRMLRPLHSVH